MEPRKDVNSADSVLSLRNVLWILPYLAVMGLSLGYLTGGLPGAMIGLLAAIAVSVVFGPAMTIFTGALGGGAVNVFYGLGRRTIGLRDRLAADLNIVRHHKLCQRYDEALIKIEAVLAQDPVFPEALFLKAQILWEGFEERRAAKQCLLEIIKAQPDKEAVFHRWALNFYGDIQKERKFQGR